MSEQEHEFSFKSLFVPFTSFKAIQWIIFIGLVVYANMLFNGFVYDDVQILTNPSLHSFPNITEIFFKQTQGILVNGYYRPLTFEFYALLYSLFGANTFFYHIVQLVLHISNSILLFLIFKKIMKHGIAFILALLFLIHPINEEAVVYISDLQDVLFVFFGLLSFHIFQLNITKMNRIIITNVLLIFSLLSKETGLLFYPIILFYTFIFQKKNFLIQSFISVAVVSIYPLIRFGLFPSVPLASSVLIPIQNMNIYGRLINIPAIILYYLHILFYPDRMETIHSWVVTSIQYSTFYLPFLLDCIFFISIILVCIFIYIKSKNWQHTLLFWGWFVLGFFAHIQIFPLGATVADRYFYFPFIGLLGIVGLALSNIQLNKLGKIIVFSTGLIILVALSSRVVIRNMNWVNETTLITHDQNESSNDYLQTFEYASLLINQGNYNSAYIYMKKATELFPQSARAWDSLGVLYYLRKDIPDAKMAYLKSIKISNYYNAYENMGVLLINNSDTLQARDFLRNATALFPNDAKLWHDRTIAEYKSGDKVDALLTAKKYYDLSGDDSYYNTLMQGLPLNLK